MGSNFLDIICILCVFIGLTSSFYLDITPGGTIVMTAILLYIIMTIIRQGIAFKERRKEQILSSFGDE